VQEQDYVCHLNNNMAYLMRAARAMLGNEVDASDAVQETSLKGFVCREQLRGGEEAFRPWMRRILLHVCLGVIKQRGKIVPLGGREELIPSEQMAHEKSAEHEVWEAVAALPEQLREVVAMRYVFDLSQEDISVRLGIPAGTVKSRINRSLEHLRKQLKTREEAVSNE